MNLFRGTPVPETGVNLRAFPCVFFAWDYNEAIDYATGGEQEDGYIQEYYIPDDLNLYDLDEDRSVAEEFLRSPLTKSVYQNLIYYPPKEWIAFLKERGFDGIISDTYTCVFVLHGIKLLNQWKLEYDEERRKYEGTLVH